MKKKKIIVLGFMGIMPIAGVIWQHIHYIVGLQRLGHDVYYVEDTERYPFDPIACTTTDDYSYAAATLHQLSLTYGFEGKWVFCARYRNPIETAGMSRLEMLQLFRESDCALNICGSHLILEEHELIDNLIYVESDPGVEQIKVDKGDLGCIQHLQKHHHLCTFGELIGTASFPVPLHGLRWIPTRQPVVLDLWRSHHVSGSAPFSQRKLTSICNWSTAGQKDIEWRGSTYLWSKSREFLRFIRAPLEVAESFELATDLKTDEMKEIFQQNHWQIVSPHELSMDMNAYRSYILESKGEFTCAKDQYVRLATGWFSDRSACFLAAGKPVITQETGFSSLYGNGTGLIGFTEYGQIKEAVRSINLDYALHSRAASELAHSIFDATKVLARLLDDVQVGSA